MASRWRVWEGEAHVDAHGCPPKITYELVPVLHSFDWNDVQDILGNVVIPEDLQKKMKEKSSAMKKYEMKGVKKGGSPNSVIRGRAEILRMRLGTRAPGPSSLRKQSPQHESGNGSVSSPPNEESFTPDEQTLCFKHLPNNLTEKELEGSVSQFGKVSMCKIHPGEFDSVGYVRLEEASACDWVISYYRGMPYDDNCAPLECDYVIEHARY